MKKPFIAVLIFLSLCSIAFAQANGKLQIHFMDVGQADSTLLISPQGETVLFDNGVSGYCDMPISYLQQLGVTKIDYHIASHYHSDHLGCTSEVLSAFPLQKAAYDRGLAPTSAKIPAFYKTYVDKVGSKRKTAVKNQTLSLDGGTVTIKFVALNGNGISTKNENDLSVVALITYGKFHAVMGGDLSGYNERDYRDIETSVAPLVGTVEVYKVNHHCSRYSSNPVWLETTTPKVGIISASSTKGLSDYHHPTEECLDRLHNAGVKAYWTESGTGGKPDPEWDLIAGNIVIEVEPGKDNFTVSTQSRTDTFPVWKSASSSTTTETHYAWSKNSTVYHYMDCSYVKNIGSTNLRTGTKPPSDKSLHSGCPK
jgi:beta-lactamase superfamily II metal-dependent hydrolase